MWRSPPSASERPSASDDVRRSRRRGHPRSVYGCDEEPHDRDRARATGWQYGTWLFPQAAVFFPSAWAEIVPRGAIWFVFAAISVLAAGVGARGAPAGHRGYGVFRSLTICGAVIAVVLIVLVVGASFITL